jgi:hypothetical protein
MKQLHRVTIILAGLTMSLLGLAAATPSAFALRLIEQPGINTLAAHSSPTHGGTALGDHSDRTCSRHGHRHDHRCHPAARLWPHRSLHRAPAQHVSPNPSGGSRTPSTDPLRPAPLDPAGSDTHPMITPKSPDRDTTRSLNRRRLMNTLID